jgi:uncharacterized protein
VEIVIAYFNEFWHLFNEMAIYLLFGFLFAGVLHVFIRKERVGHYLGGNNFRAVANASLFGVPLPLCSCGVIPAGLSFRKNGASKGATVSFLISTPQTGIDSMMVTYSMLGLPMAIVRPIVAFVTGIAGGLLINKFGNGKGEQEIAVPEEKSIPQSFSGKVREVFRYGFVEFLQDISKWLIIGLAAAALLSLIIPKDFFTTYIEYRWLNMLLVLAASVPLYICATGSVPIAAVLMMKGLSPGAALVFLMAGPATNIATIAVLGKSLGKIATAIYLLTIIAGAVLFGLFIDTFLPAEWFTGLMDHSMHNHADSGWLFTTASVALVVLLINGLIINIKQNLSDKKQTLNANNMAVRTFIVEGMTCKNCKSHVEKDIRNLDGVEDVIADLATGEVKVSGKTLDPDKIKLAVEHGGYNYKGEKKYESPKGSDHWLS